MEASSPIIVIMAVVVALIGVALLAVFSLTRGYGRKILNQDWYRTAWLEIENNINRDNSDSYQFAILSADKLLDRALKESGFEGKTMGDRLRSAERALQNIDGVWAAHKLRNKIAHEVGGGKINKTIAKRMLTIYKNALKDLGAI